MAAQTKARINPALLTWARTSAGFSLAEAEKKLGLEAGRLEHWESGSEALSIPQLRKLADAYKRPLAVFYLPKAPKDFQVIRDLRRLPGHGFRRMPPELVLEIRRASQQRDLALDMLADLEVQPLEFGYRAQVTDDPEKLGARIRQALGITLPLQMRWRDQDGRAAFNAWRERIEDLGVLVFQMDRFGAEIASGFAIFEPQLPVIAVNRKATPFTRRTFSLLHEFAHLMLRVSGVSDLDADDTRPPEDQTVEVFCNRVAAASLIPETDLLARPEVQDKAFEWSDVQLSAMARDFGVSREAVVRRLLTFGRATDSFYRKKRQQYADELEKQRALSKQQKGEPIPRNMPRETVSNLGRPLVKLVLGNYRQDRLSLSEVSGYLGLKTKYIPKLEQAVGLE